MEDDFTPAERVPIPAAMRRAMLERDEHACRKCGRLDTLHGHHIVAVQDHGPTELANLITLCFGCHYEWHAVESASTLPFDEWLRWPPAGRLIGMLLQPAPDDMTAEEYRQSLLSLHRIYAAGRRRGRPPIDLIDLPRT